MWWLIMEGNVFARLAILCLTAQICILTLDFRYEILPLNPTCLLLYTFTLLCATVWFTFVVLQALLNKSAPCDLKYFLQKYWKIESGDVKANDANERIRKFTEGIRESYLRRWYQSHIGSDETFLNETSDLLDGLVKRFLQVVSQIDSDHLTHGILVILLRHVKEFRKAVKKGKRNEISVESAYRYFYADKNGDFMNEDMFEHLTHELTSKILRHFISWEVYSSLACRCVISVLAKKLVRSTLIQLSAPSYVNSKLARRTRQTDRTEEDARVEYRISIADVDHSICTNISRPRGRNFKIEHVNVQEEIREAGRIDEIDAKPQHANKLVRTPQKVSAGTSVSTSSSSEEIKGFASEPVKIYESKRAENKTWRNSRDLACVSLGQDLLILEQLDTINDDKRHEEVKRVPKEHVLQSHLSTRDAILEELETSAAECTKLITNTIKPFGNATANTMKEFQQSTAQNVAKVSQATTNAMHKIGDFQDEAAGMVEGIFDFGMAGLRKGLRLTGLQELETSVTPKRDIPGKTKQKLAKVGHVHSDDHKIVPIVTPSPPVEIKGSCDTDEHVWVNPLNNSSPSFEGDILLEKSPSADSQSMSSESNKMSDVPLMEIIPAVDESPIIEYEDTNDLATTTAKLRSLLAQKTSESTLNTPSASPMSVLVTPNSIEEMSYVDGAALPSMYRAWAKTATGVFQNTLNTLKTALPGNAGDEFHTPAVTPRTDNSERQWMFLCSDPEVDDVSTHIERFLKERREYCTVDNAYEAIESIEIDSSGGAPLKNRNVIDDELDDFDTSIPMSKAFIDLTCELIEETYPPLVKENVIKALLLLGGKELEEQLHGAGLELIKMISELIDELPNGSSKKMPGTAMDLNELIDRVLGLVPLRAKQILKEDSLRHVIKLCLESIQSHQINRDTAYQLFELFGTEIIKTSGQTSPIG